MKRIFKSLLLFAVLCVGMTFTAAADDWTSEDGLYELRSIEQSDGSLKITGAVYNGTEIPALVIPAEINGKPVTAIGDGAFYNRSFLTGTLELPETLVTIGEGAFKYCGFTGELVIPDSVTTIGAEAFYECEGLTGLKLSKNLTELGRQAFYWCKSITGDLTIPGGVKDVPYAVFHSVPFDGDLVLEEGVETIGSDAFNFCDFTGTLTLPETLTSIGSQAFIGCPFSGELILPESLTTIEQYAFAYSKGFTGDLVIPDSIKRIEDKVFSGGKFDGNLYLPENLEFIGGYAFENCTFTGDVVIPDSVTSMESNIFNGCTGNDLVLGTGVPDIPESAFNNTRFTGELIIPEGITSIGGGAFGGAGFPGDLILPDSLVTIGNMAFYGAKFSGSLIMGDGLVSIGSEAFCGTCFTGDLTVGASLTTVGSNAFYGLTSEPKFQGDLTINDASFPAFAGNWGLLAGSYLAGDVTILKGDIPDDMFYRTKHEGTLTLGEGVTSIGNDAFINCTGLTGPLVLPESLESIGDGAFNGCTGFTSLTVSDSISSIGAKSFYGCTGLTGTLNIPDTVTSIGEYAFYNCSGLTGDLHISAGMSTIEPYTFYGCTGLTGALTLHDGIYAVADYAFYGCTGLTSLDLGEGVLVLGPYAFTGCTGFGGSLVIPDSVQTMGDYVFDGCAGFARLSIGDGITEIPGFAFRNCTGLTGTITIDDDMTRVGAYAFYNCAGFTRLSLGENLQIIGSFAFYGCTGLRGTLKLPEGLVEIGNSAFEYCSGFVGDLIIPNSVTYVGSGAFAYCSGFGGDLIIGNGVKYCDAFQHCTGFTGDCILGGQMTTIPSLYGCTGFRGALFIPEGVKKLDAGILDGNAKFSSLYIPVSLTKLTGTSSYGTEFATVKNIYYAGTKEEFDSHSYYFSHFTNGWNENPTIHYNAATMPTSIILSGRNTVQVGNYIALSATVMPYTASDRSVTWSSSDTTVATVSDGVVTGVSEGTATITARTSNGLTASRVVTVKNDICQFLVYGVTREAPTNYVPLANASVNIQGVSRTTDENGVAEFDAAALPTEGYAVATVSCDGYFTEQRMVFFIQGYEHTFCLKSKGDDIYFTSVTLRTNNQTVDLMDTKTVQRIPMLIDGQLSEKSYPVYVAVDWNDYEKGTIVLRGTETGNEIALKDGATKTVAFAQHFDVGEELKLVAVTTNDQGEEVRLEKTLPVEVYINPMIEVPPTGPTNSDDIYFLNEGTTEEDAEPALGQGIKVELKLGELAGIASNVSYKDGVLTLKFTGKDSSEKKFDMFDGIAAGKSGPTVSLTGTIQIPLADPYSKDSVWSGSITASVTEKASASVSTESDRPTNEAGEKIPDVVPVQLFRHRYNFFTAGVPCFVDSSFSVGASAMLKLHGPYDQIYFTGEIKGSGSASVKGGVGGSIGGKDGDALALEIYIKGNLGVEFPVTYTATSLEDSTWDFNPSIKGTVSGGATLNLCVISFSEEIKLGEVKWDRNGVSWDSDLVEDIALQAAGAEWAFVGREYLENGGGIAGELVLLSADGTRTPVAAYENIIPCADAVLTVIDGTPYLLFSMDDVENQDEYNNMRLAYRAWNGEGWGEDNWVSEDLSADYAMAADGAFVAWEDSGVTLTADTTVDEMLSASEITVGVFNGTGYDVTTLTADENYDHSVKVSAAGETALVAWLSNDAASITGAEGITSINYATYSEAGWSAVTTVADVGAVTNLYTAYDGTTGTIYYKNSDNTFFTISTADNVKTETGDTVGRYCAAQVNGEEIVAHFDGEGDLHIDRNGVEEASIATEFSGNENPVMAATADGTVIFWIEHGGIYYTANLGDGWSGRLCLKTDAALVKELSCRMLDAETYMVSYLRTENDVTDLMTLYASVGADLAVLYAEADEETYRDSGMVAYEAEIFNNGEVETENFTLEVYDESEELIHSAEIYETIRPGERVLISDGFTPVDGSVIHDYTVRVNLAGDYNDGNNEDWFSVGSADAEIVDAEFTGETLCVILQNNGSAAISGAVLQIYADSEDGELLYETEVTDLTGGTLQAVEVPLTQDPDIVYYIRLHAEDEDESNNLRILAYDDQVPALDADLAGDGLLTVSINTRKVDVANARVLVAVKNENGRLLKIAPCSLEGCGTLDGIMSATTFLTGLPDAGGVQVLLLQDGSLAPMAKDVWVDIKS